jgi:hypothetical protein
MSHMVQIDCLDCEQEAFVILWVRTIRVQCTIIVLCKSYHD